MDENLGKSNTDQACPVNLVEGATQNDSPELYFVGAYDRVPNYVWESNNISIPSRNRRRPRKYSKRKKKCSGEGLLVDFPMPTTSSMQQSNTGQMLIAISTHCFEPATKNL